MRNQKKMLLEQLDRKLSVFKAVEIIGVPSSGWIKNIRVAMNMTMVQLAKKLGMTSQGIKKLEEREALGSITINSLKKVGKALDLRFVYGFVPVHGSVENLVDMKSRQLAEKIVLRTHQNMKLEDQGNSDRSIAKAIDELAMDIKREMRKSIWEI